MYNCQTSDSYACSKLCHNVVGSCLNVIIRSTLDSFLEPVLNEHFYVDFVFNLFILFYLWSAPSKQKMVHLLKKV